MVESVGEEQMSTEDVVANIILAFNLGTAIVVFITAIYLARQTFLFIRLNGEQAETSTKTTFGIFIVASMTLVLARINEFLHIMLKLQGTEIIMSDILSSVLMLYH